MMHNIGPFHVNGNVLTKHGRTVGEPAMLIMRTEDFCVPVKIGSKSISLYHISASLGLAKTKRISTFSGV